MNFVQSPELLEAERREKESRVQQYLAERGLGALVLTRVENFAWLTAGANNRIVTTEEAGAASLIYTADGGKYVVTNVSEARRMQEEEFAGLGWEVRSTRWDQSQAYLIHEVLN
ncbi:MAG TPA: aminopeptidase P family N-terminal domain-containing protein, partial [Symbiobacteriaceae bacterium]|nr:aminopeptidase P family N-terminal domain-containing protein [Symbiobacteriaceae bacterium]